MHQTFAACTTSIYRTDGTWWKQDSVLYVLAFTAVEDEYMPVSECLHIINVCLFGYIATLKMGRMMDNYSLNFFYNLMETVCLQWQMFLIHLMWRFKMFSVIFLYSKASGESCLNVKSGPGSNFMLLEHVLLTLTSFSLILLVAPLGFYSRSVPPSFSQSVPAPNRSWFSLVYNVVPLLLLHLYCYSATYLRRLLALRRSCRPFIAPLILRLTLFRVSGLSLGGMHPRSVPDAEAHGKDGNNCPQQLCISNGEMVFNLVFESINLDLFR